MCHISNKKTPQRFKLLKQMFIKKPTFEEEILFEKQISPKTPIHKIRFWLLLHRENKRYFNFCACLKSKIFKQIQILKKDSGKNQILILNVSSNIRFYLKVSHHVKFWSETLTTCQTLI